MDWEGFSDWASMAPFIGVMIVALAVLFALSVYETALIRRSLNSLAQRSGVATFAIPIAQDLDGLLAPAVRTGSLQGQMTTSSRCYNQF